GFLKLLEPSLGLKRYLKLGEVNVLCVAQASQKKPIHDFRQHLIARPDAAIGRHIKNDGMRRNFLVDGFQNNIQLWITRSRCKTVRGRNTQNVAVLNRKTKYLGKARFAGAEEARYPDSHSLVGFLCSLMIPFQYLHEVLF